MSKVIQVVVSDDEYNAITKEAENQGRKVSQMARRLIVNGLKPNVDFDVVESNITSEKIASSLMQNRNVRL